MFGGFGVLTQTWLSHRPAKPGRIAERMRTREEQLTDAGVSTLLQVTFCYSPLEVNQFTGLTNKS